MGGAVGLQYFGAAQANFTFGLKDGKCHFHRSGSLKRFVPAAEKAPMVLYDTMEKRAWLVPASGVMIHSYCSSSQFVGTF